THQKHCLFPTAHTVGDRLHDAGVIPTGSHRLRRRAQARPRERVARAVGAVGVIPTRHTAQRLRIAVRRLAPAQGIAPRRALDAAALVADGSRAATQAGVFGAGGGAARAAHACGCAGGGRAGGSALATALAGGAGPALVVAAAGSEGSQQSRGRGQGGAQGGLGERVAVPLGGGSGGVAHSFPPSCWSGHGPRCAPATSGLESAVGRAAPSRSTAGSPLCHSATASNWALPAALRRRLAGQPTNQLSPVAK